jgi:hypothetical protein
MSRAIKGVSLFVIMVAFIAIMLTLHGRATRANENTNALVTAIETSLGSVMDQKAYGIEDSDEFVADFLQTLLLQYKSDSEITVKVIKQDMEKGLLSVEVDEKYSHPNGKAGAVSVRRTVIFDKKAPEDPVYHKIQYVVDGECYKEFSLLEGEPLVVPQEPEKEGHSFLYWWDNATGRKVDAAGMTADKDYELVAKFN